MQQHQKNNSYSRDSSLLGAWNNQQCNTKISLVHGSSFVFTELHFLKIEFQEALLTWKLQENFFQSIRVQFLQILYSTVHENNMNIDTCSVLQHVTTQAVWNNHLLKLAVVRLTQVTPKDIYQTSLCTHWNNSFLCMQQKSQSPVTDVDV